MNTPTCGECIYWQRAGKHSWGNCLAPAPYWVDQEGPILFDSEPMAEHCPLFKERELTND